MPICEKKEKSNDGGIRYNKAVTGIRDENFGSVIQKHYENEDLLPDMIEVWRSPSGKISFKFGYLEV